MVYALFRSANSQEETHRWPKCSDFAKLCVGNSSSHRSDVLKKLGLELIDNRGSLHCWTRQALLCGPCKILRVLVAMLSTM